MQAVKNNGTLYAHVVLARAGVDPDMPAYEAPADSVFSKSHSEWPSQLPAHTQPIAQSQAGSPASSVLREAATSMATIQAARTDFLSSMHCSTVIGMVALLSACLYQQHVALLVVLCRPHIFPATPAKQDGSQLAE
jgi:hypothetical protein